MTGFREVKNGNLLLGEPEVKMSLIIKMKMIMVFPANTGTITMK